MKEVTTINKAIKSWAIEYDRRMVMEIPKSYNPLLLVTELISMSKHRGYNKIIIVVDTLFFKEVYKQYFKEHVEFQCEVITAMELRTTNRREYDLLICDLLDMHEKTIENLTLFIKTPRYFIMSSNITFTCANIKMLKPYNVPSYVLPYDLHREDREKYIAYDDYIIANYRVYKAMSKHFIDSDIKVPHETYDIIRYCINGIYINDNKISATSLCNSIAKAEGWHKDLIGDTPANKSLITYFHPDNIRGNAIQLNQYIKFRKQLIYSNSALLNVIRDFRNVYSMVILDTVKTAEYISKVINNWDQPSSYQSLPIGNSLTTRTMRDLDTNNIILTKKGKDKPFGTTSLIKFAKMASEEGKVKLFITSSNIKCVNIPREVNWVVSTVIDSTLVDKFGEESNDLEAILEGESTFDGLPDLKGHIWLIPNAIENADGSIRFTKPYLTMARMQAEPYCNRLIYAKNVNDITSTSPQ